MAFFYRQIMMLRDGKKDARAK